MSQCQNSSCLKTLPTLGASIWPLGESLKAAGLQLLSWMP
jgi:hypothetical protein